MLTPANPVGANAIAPVVVGDNPDAYAYSISEQRSRLFSGDGSEVTAGSVR